MVNKLDCLIVFRSTDVKSKIIAIIQKADIEIEMAAKATCYEITNQNDDWSDVLDFDLVQ